MESERHDRVALGDQLLQARKPRGAAPPHEIRALCSKSKNGVTLVCQRAQACKPRRTGNRIILNQFESRLLNIVRCSKHVSSATRCTCNCILDRFKQFVCGVVGFNDFTEPPCARALKSKPAVSPYVKAKRQAALSRTDHCVSVESERHDRVALGDQLLQARKPRGAAPPHEIRALCSKSKNGVTLVCQRAQACKPRRTGNRIILNQFESRLLNIVRCSKHVSSATRCTCNCILDRFKQFVCGVVGFNDFTEPPCARALKSNRDVITL